MSPYVGKVYKDGMTEVFSMGLEHLFRNPITLAVADPEHLAVTVQAIFREPAPVAEGARVADYMVMRAFRVIGAEVVRNGIGCYRQRRGHC